MISPPILSSPAQEEWTDADFDLPDGQAIHTPSEKDDDEDEDWDMEMDFGKTGGAKVQALPRADPPVMSSEPKMTIFRPSSSVSSSQGSSTDDDDDEEGLSTIRMPLRLPAVVDRPKSPIDEDFEDGFSLPSDLTRLSLAPLTLSHRTSKQSLEWEDKDNTTSSQSSDAYSTLGFANTSPSSPSSWSSASVSNVETEDECEDDLDGLVIPPAIFDSGHGFRHLSHLLALKKVAPNTAPSSSATSLNPEDDFEMGLVIDDDVVLSPSRLLQKTQPQPQPRLRRITSRTTSVPQKPPTTLRPVSRVKSDGSKSPVNPPPQASAHQLQKLRLSPSPPLRPPTRSRTFQAFPSPPPVPTSFLQPKPGSLRAQKSHSGLQIIAPAPSKKATRKASLSSLMQPPPQASGSASASGSSSATTSKGRLSYDQPTAASRAKTQHKASTSHLHQDYQTPVRTSSPANNISRASATATMPAPGRSRLRAALSSVFRESSPSVAPPSPRLSTSPLPPQRPPSKLSKTSRIVSPVPAPPAVTKVLRKPKRVRTFGDGTELDAFDDLPTDRDQESRFRVQPKGYGNRVPGGSYASKIAEATPAPTPAPAPTRRTLRSNSAAPPPPPSLRRASKMDLSSLRNAGHASPPKKKKVATSPSTQTKRKPTLIRNLGGAASPKVVGDMKWNPQTLRWEGNDQVLKEFDAVVTSTRPALITHLSGAMGSPVMSLAAGARRVGNMIFDPSKMCWISALSPEEDEPDVFADLADDEEDHSWEAKGGTIRATMQPNSISVASSISSMLDESRDCLASIRSQTRTPSDCGSERGSRASLMCSNVDEAFVARCRVAEERHRNEMSGWVHALAVRPPSDNSFLYEIRALATRKY